MFVRVYVCESVTARAGLCMCVCACKSACMSACVCKRPAHLGLPGDGGHVADLFGAQGVDYGALAHVGVTDEPHADLLLIAMELQRQNTPSPEETVYVFAQFSFRYSVATAVMSL